MLYIKSYKNNNSYFLNLSTKEKISLTTNNLITKVIYCYFNNTIFVLASEEIIRYTSFGEFIDKKSIKNIINFDICDEYILFNFVGDIFGIYQMENDHSSNKLICNLIHTIENRKISNIFFNKDDKNQLFYSDDNSLFIFNIKANTEINIKSDIKNNIVNFLGFKLLSVYNKLNCCISIYNLDNLDKSIKKINIGSIVYKIISNNNNIVILCDRFKFNIKIYEMLTFNLLKNINLNVYFQNLYNVGDIIFGNEDEIFISCKFKDENKSYKTSIIKFNACNEEFEIIMECDKSDDIVLTYIPEVVEYLLK